MDKSVGECFFFRSYFQTNSHAVYSALVIACDRNVPVLPSAEAVVRTLASLVPGAVEGLLRDVVLTGPANSKDLRRISDHAGCHLVEAPEPSQTVPLGLAQIRCDRVLVLRAGYAVERAFVDELADLDARISRLRAVLMRSEPEGLLTRIWPALAPAAGLVAMRDALDGRAVDFESLIRKCRPRSALRTQLRRVS